MSSTKLNMMSVNMFVVDKSCFATTLTTKTHVQFMLARLAVSSISSVHINWALAWISPAGIPDSSSQSATKSLSSSSGDTSRAKVVSGRSLGAQKTVTSIVYYFRGRTCNRMRLVEFVSQTKTHGEWLEFPPVLITFSEKNNVKSEINIKPKVSRYFGLAGKASDVIVSVLNIKWQVKLCDDARHVFRHVVNGFFTSLYSSFNLNGFCSAIWWRHWKKQSKPRTCNLKKKE